MFTKSFGVAGLAAVTLSGALAMAGPGDWHRESRGRGGWNIRASVEVPVLHDRVVVRDVQRIEVAPCDVRFSAYRTGDRIVIVASGENRGSGYATTLSAGEVCDGAVTLVLRNSIAGRCADDRINGFSLSASIRARRDENIVRIRSGERTYEVAVTDAPCLN